MIRSFVSGGIVGVAQALMVRRFLMAKDLWTGHSDYALIALLMLVGYYLLLGWPFKRKLNSGGYWMIWFEDSHVQPELFTDWNAAVERFEVLEQSWACHLFQIIE